MTKKASNRVCVLPGEYLSPEEYVQDLIDQLKNDIYPLFNVRGNAPFTISRNIFCFIDHVSVLKYGYKDSQTYRIKELISELASFDSYINSKYKIYAPYIVQIYRHDLVHNIRPFPHNFKIIEAGTKVEKYAKSWFLISSNLGKKCPKPKTFYKLAKHFKNINNRKNLCHLRYHSSNQIAINNYCLFFDLVNFLYEYKEQLKSDKSLSANFIKNYEQIVSKGINQLEKEKFVLDKNKDRECKEIF